MLQTYKILLTCPNCGGSTWVGQDKDGAFECGACGDLVFTEDMFSKVMEEFCGYDWRRQ